MYERMKNKRISAAALLLIGSFILSSCSVGNKPKKFRDQYEITNDVPSSYSLMDDGFIADVELQMGGTCWSNAATTVMEYGYRKYGKRSVEMDAVALAVMVYNPHSPEGYSAGSRDSIYDAGGTAEMVVHTASNGFGSYTLVDSCEISPRNATDIKRAIMTFGGITVGLSENDSNYMYTGETFTMIASDSDEINHQAVIVGWDDDFPAEDFVSPASQNGAWLVQNSYSSDWGDNGFYWVSYDTPITDLHTMVMSIDYSSVAYYESGCTATLEYGNEVTVANVFNKTGRLGAVGTYTTRPNQHIVVTIYSKDMTTVLDSYEATFEFQGYHTIELDEPLSSDGVAIAVTYTGAAPMEGESSENYGIYYYASIEEGQSFIREGNEWLDLSQSETLTTIGLSESCNNCCIKALYL